MSKNYPSFIFNLFFPFVILIGCVASAQDSQAVKAKNEMQAKSFTPFQERILGHWVTEKSKTEYFIGKETLFMIDNGKSMGEIPYVIFETNETESVIKIQLVNKINTGHKKSLNFSPDFKSISEIMSFEVMGKVVEVSEKWNFVDSKTSP